MKYQGVKGESPTAQTKAAAPAGPRNGGTSCERAASAFNECFYQDDTSAATLAARWYTENRAGCPHPVIPTLRSMFGLSALEAVQAIRIARGGAR